MYGPLGFALRPAVRQRHRSVRQEPDARSGSPPARSPRVLCMAGVAATYWAARRLWGVREGLVAAALLAFAFLPVAYSRVAVTDVGALAGRGARARLRVRAYEDGRIAPLRCSPARRPAWRCRSSTPPAWRCCRSALAALARLRDDPLRAARRPGPRDRPRRARLRGAQPVPVRLARRLVERPARPGRGGGGPAEAGPGVGRRLLLPRQPHLGPRLGRGARGAGRRRARAAPRPGARADARGGAGGAVRLPQPPVALLRALAAPRLPGAGDARRGGARCRGRGRVPAAPRRFRCAPSPLPALRARWCSRSRWPPTSAARRCSAARTPASRRATGSRRTTRPELRLADRARGARPLVPLEPGGRPTELAQPLRRSAAAGPSRAWYYVADGGRRICAQYKPGLLRARTAACARPPITRARARGDRRLPPLRLLPRHDRRRGARPRASRRATRRRAPTTSASSTSRGCARVQPVRRGRRPRAVQLRPLLQLLPHGYQRPGRRAGLPAGRLPPGIRPSPDSDPEGPRASARSRRATRAWPVRRSEAPGAAERVRYAPAALALNPAERAASLPQMSSTPPSPCA